MNRKVSILAAGGFGILGIVVGLALRLVAPQFFAAAVTPINRTVKITLQNPVAGVYTCDFRADNADGQFDAYKFPVLTPRHGGHPGDTVTWSVVDGRTGMGGAALPFEVDFPQNNTPFTDANDNPKWKFTNADPSSGDSKKSRSDFAYDQVIATTPDVGPVNCSNARDPGVHVDK